MMKMFLMAILVPLVFMIFFSSLHKLSKFDNLTSSIFECGFSSYYFSRFSFSIHYIMVGLLFLFLDMEICSLIPLVINNSLGTFLKTHILLLIFVLFLTLCVEWSENKLEWKN